MPLSGRVLRRHSQQPADGLLSAGAARARRARSRRRDPRSRRQFQRVGLHARAAAPAREDGHAIRLGFRLIHGLERRRAEKPYRRARQRLCRHRAARRNAPASRALPSNGWPKRMRSARWASTGAPRCGRRAGSTPSAPRPAHGRARTLPPPKRGGQEECAAAASAASERRAFPGRSRRIAGHGALRTCRRGLRGDRPVAEGASGAVFPRLSRPRSAPFAMPTSRARRCGRIQTSPSPAWCWCGSGRERRKASSS